MFLKCVIIIVNCLCFLSAEQNKNLQEQMCGAQQTCRSCVQTPTCIWCAEVTPQNEKKVDPIRCIPRDKYSERWCSLAHVINETSTFNITKDTPLTSGKGKEPVQVQPQKVLIRLRKGEEIRLKFNYTQADDYPVDMYYLMDLSASMQQYRHHLSEMGVHLARTMKNITGNFRLGFGSFVDKVALPMTDTHPDKLKVPCTYIDGNKKTNCASPYGYKHQMSLTEDSLAFRTNVNAAPISGNLDAPEGGLDALMQSIVCTDRIGWRPKARHLLVFSTDASFHLAGDGKLAGIVEPNDCTCHLDKSGTYTHSLLQDYPSISQVNRKAVEHNIHIIFAVPKIKNETYQLLSQSIKGSSIGIVEKNDTLNVINLIKGEYEKLVESIILIDNAPKYISVQYFSKCLNKSSELKQRSKCDGLRFGDVVEFEIVLKLLECPLNGGDFKQFEIKPQGLNESLNIELELICECPCDKPFHAADEIKSDKCNNHGSLICGICICDGGYHGKYCDCYGNNNDILGDTNSTKNVNCRALVNDTVDCNGHGTCKCGSCECDVRPNPWERFSGKYCECNNFSCKRSGRLLCGGNGDCVCGTCDCNPGWTGDSCGCHDNTTCFPPAAGMQNVEICSGHGYCDCGKCYCKSENNVVYSGNYCEDCLTCSGLHCEKLKNCVECEWIKYNSKIIDNDLLNSENSACNSCHDEVVVERVDKVEINSTEHEAGIRMCRIPTLNDGCTFVYKYELVNRGDISVFKIFLQEKKDCPSLVPIVGVAIGVIVSTVLLGFIGLIIWKVVTTIHDEREYAKFEKERAMAKWERGENPLYKKATTTFANPTFNENCGK